MSLFTILFVEKCYCLSENYILIIVQVSFVQIGTHSLEMKIYPLSISRYYIILSDMR